MEDKDIVLARRGLELIHHMNDTDNKMPNDWVQTLGFNERKEPNPSDNSYNRLDYSEHTSVNIGRGSNNSFPILHTYPICFGSMDGIGPDEKTTALFASVPLKHRNICVDKQVVTRSPLMNYFVNDSGWRKAMLPMSGEEALVNGIIVDGLAPVSLSFGALLMYKILYKHSDTIYIMWNDMIEMGCNPHLAFLQLFIYGSSIPGIRNRTLPSLPVRFFMYNKQAINRYIAGTPVKKTPSYYDSGKYRGYGYNPSNFTQNDYTCNHAFVTRDEFVTSLESNRGGLPGELSSSLITHLNKNGFNLNEDNHYCELLASLTYERAQQVFIDWTREEFPKLYAT